MPMRAVQQIMLGTVTAKENQAVQTLSAIKKAGYDGIELNGFMIRPTSFMVRMMTEDGRDAGRKRRESGLGRSGEGGRIVGGKCT